MRSVKIALGGGLALLALAIVAVLSHSPLVAVGSNSVQAPLYRNGGVPGSSNSCQPAGTLPRGTSAVRISLGANVNPKIIVKVFSGARLITRGEQGAGGGLNASATVPVRPVTRAVPNAVVCFTLGPSAEVVGIRGIPARPSPSTLYELRDVKLRMEYLRRGPSSWWSRVSTIADHFGLGRVPGGTWVGFLVIAVMLAVAALASRLTLKELG
jgi:hypothetical protein